MVLMIEDIQLIPVEAGLSIIGIGVAIALLFAASLLRAKTSRPKQNNDSAPTTLSSPDDFTPFLEGTFIQGYAVGWAGNRKTERTGGGGGKGLGGGGDPEEIDHQESAVHWWGPGPYTALTEIRVNNQIKWSGYLSPIGTPSGTRVQFGDIGSAVIYWGETDQPIDEQQAQWRGIRSRWPRAAHINWDRFSKGAQTQWPQVEYKLTRRLASGVAGSDSYIATAFSTGINAAHAMCRIITTEANIDPAILDQDSLEDFGELMVSEAFPINYLSPGGSNPDTVETFMQAVAVNIGVMFPQIGKSIAIVPIRNPAGAIPSYSTDEIEDPAPELIKQMQNDRADYVRFSFVDENFNYRSRPLVSADNSMRSSGGRPMDSKIDLATSAETAGTVARRREQEPGGTGDEKAVTVNLLRGAKLQHPGSLIDVEDVGRLRVFRRRIFEDSARVELQCRIDGYAVPVSENEFGDGSDFDDPKVPEADISFAWYTVPYNVGASRTSIVVFRVEAHNQIDGAFVHVSIDGGGSYTRVGSQIVPAAGGLLIDSIGTTSPTVTNGPIFLAQDSRTNEVLDLSGNTNAWEAGQQLVVFDDGVNVEIAYLQEVEVQAESDWVASTAYSLDDVVVPTGDGTVTGLRYVCTVAGTSAATEPDWPRQTEETIVDGTATWEAQYFTYQLKGIIRGQFLTTATAFAADTQIYIIPQDALQFISSSLIVNGEGLCVKTQPYGTGGAPVDLSAVTAVCGAVDDQTPT